MKDSESRNQKLLKMLVDFSLSIIAQTGHDIEWDFSVVESVRERAVKMFPDKEKTFFMIYFPRFRRVLMEKYGAEAEYFDHSLNTKFEEYFGVSHNKVH